MRRLAIALGATAAAASLVLGSSAQAVAPADLLLSISDVAVSAEGPSQQTSVTVETELGQNQYANISYNVTLQGFRVLQSIPSATLCPASAISVKVPQRVSVTGCALAQKGTNAVLSLVLSGVFILGPITVTLKRGLVMTPRPPGTYTIAVSSWAFPTESTPVVFAAESYPSCDVLRQDYPSGIAGTVGAMNRAMAAGRQRPLVNPAVFRANRSFGGPVNGAVCLIR